MPILRFPEWAPDQPDFQNQGSPLIRNVVPLTAQSYGPMPTPFPYTDNGLDERCQGAYALKDTDGIVHLIAGDRQNLYRIPPGGKAFTYASRVVGGAYATPNVAGGGHWSMTAYGDRVIATNYVDPIQSMLLSDTNFTDLSPDAPHAKYVTTVKDFVMVANTNDGTYGPVPYRVWWSAIAEPTTWPTPGSITAAQLQSDFQDLVQTDVGMITGLTGGFLGAVDAGIFCERGIWAASYTGPPTLFAFRIVQGAPGTTSPLSIVPGRANTNQGTKSVCYYLGEDGFNLFDGTSSISIGSQKFDQEFFRELDGTHLNYVQGVADPRSKLIFWAFVGNGSHTDLFSRILVYNWELSRGVVCELVNPTYWGEWLTRGLYANSYNLDQLDQFGNLDVIQPSLDDSFWVGNSQARLSTFQSDHRLATWVGNAMAPTLDIGEVQPAAGRRAWITNVRPLMDGGSATVAIGHRERLTDAVTWEAEVPTNILGECPQRVTGRYLRFRFAMPAAQVFRHIQGLEVLLTPEGMLR